MNANDAAFPGGVNQIYADLDPGEPTQSGLTKRELFAAMAMQGLCACNHPQIVAWSPEELSANAREQADALLAQLSKEPT